MARVGFIGIGQMGCGMATRLAGAGFSVVGYDLSAESRRIASERGVEVADDLQKAVEGADFILSSLPNSQAVREVWLGPNGILAGPLASPVCIDLSTIDAETMKAVAAQCQARGLGVVDAPVSGGPGEAATGKLVLMIGGSDADVARAEPVLAALGETRLRTGAIGTGKTVKLVNNVMSMGSIVIAAEAFALGTAAGVEPEALFHALSQSGGRSHQFLKRFPNAIRNDWSPAFKMELGEKDVALALSFARDLKRPMPTTSTIHQMMLTALATGYAGLDIVAMLDMYQSMDGAPRSSC